MKICDVMTRNVETVTPDQTVQEAAGLMLSADTGSIPVTDGDKLVGMITDRDIAVRGIAKGYGPETLVRDLMTGDIIAVRETDDVAAVAAKMSEARVRRMPVIDSDAKLCGIVSLGDLSREAESGAATEVLSGVSQKGGAHQQ